MKRRTRRRALALASLDALLLAVSWLVAYVLREEASGLFGYSLNPFIVYVEALPAVVLPWVLVASYYGLYGRPRGLSGVGEFNAAVKTLFLGAMVVMSMGYLLRELDFGRSVVGLYLFLNAVLLGIARWVLHRVEQAQRISGRGLVPALIVGSGTTGVRALQKIQDHPEVGYRVVGFLVQNGRNLRRVGKTPVLGSLKDLRRVVEREGVEEVFVADPGLPHDEVLRMVLQCDGLDVDFRIASDLFGVLSQQTELDLLEDFPIYELASGRVAPFYDPFKRLFDTAAAGVLFVLTLPLWAIVAAAIKLDSRGPVFFVQERVGEGGRPFPFYKFRTMYVETSPYELSPRTAEDPRITRVGAWLRKTSLDEIPQLWNVLRGEMSLVGPRPEMPFLVEKYTDWERKRLEVKPGVTGLWQILGRKELPLEKNLQYDFYYIRNRSFLLDLSILWKTIPALIRRKGAF